MEDIKLVIFDIAEYKSLGRNGYSSSFYKAAWPVIGEEVTKAIMEFFSTGLLLRQLNATLLALIPKRIKEVLDKIITLSRNAFVPGRLIANNILLAHELCMGYNQKHLPRRCALNVDLRKAYDMLCFADDLLLLCEANEQSISLFKRGLEMFASRVGLHVSPTKSHLILSKSVQHNRDKVLGVLGFQEPHLPVLYLGFPLISSRLSLSDCKPLLSKIGSCIRGWGGLQLSFAARVQLITSVLMSFNIYWAMASILPKGVIREIEQRLRSFLWKGASGDRYPKVAWNQVCQLIEEGGQGIRDILAVNLALMSRHLWRITQGNSDSIWVNWIYHVQLQGKSIWTVNDRTGSCGWRKLLQLLQVLHPWVVYQVGMVSPSYSGMIFGIALGPLILQFSRGPQLTATMGKAKLQEVISNGKWNWPLIPNTECLDYYIFSRYDSLRG
ncbi:UNVERIFIED_CONTAM: hypothetical protein Sangu_2235800 [Sesamum angustifolium]|uniref:Reverse transcriptase domain-containing protein n=1 Tax=Sesamum angustifolium TaxID=2727405 RepID=A0AAW2L5Q8_9LAMI